MFDYQRKKCLEALQALCLESTPWHLKLRCNAAESLVPAATTSDQKRTDTLWQSNMVCWKIPNLL